MKTTRLLLRQSQALYPIIPELIPQLRSSCAAAFVNKSKEFENDKTIIKTITKHYTQSSPQLRSSCAAAFVNKSKEFENGKTIIKAITKHYTQSSLN